MSIRPFCNADVPRLVRLWNQHWASFGPDPQVNLRQMEQAVLSRTGFDPDLLLITDTPDSADPEDADQAGGWCQVSCDPHDPSAATITAVCLAAQADESLACELIAAAATRAEQRGVRRLSVGVIRDSRYGLAGLPPVGYGVGVADADQRLVTALQRSGFQPVQRAIRYTGSVSGYRPPINRDVVQLRRTTDIQVVSIIDETPSSAAALSHLDVEAHQLLDRDGAKITAIRMWFSDLDAKVMSPAVAIAELPAAEVSQPLSGAEAYLLSTIIGSLSIRGIAVVETVIDEEHTELASQLETLQLAPGDRGARWERS